MTTELGNSKCTLTSLRSSSDGKWLLRCSRHFERNADTAQNSQLKGEFTV